MNAKILIILFSLELAAFGQRIRSYNAVPRAFYGPSLAAVPYQPPTIDPAVFEEYRRRSQQDLDASAKDFYASIQDPIRIVDGQTNSVLGDNWVHFYGRVLQVLPEAILLNGSFSLPLGRSLSDQTDFIVMNFPYKLAEGEAILVAQNYLAKQTGVFTYETVLGASRTVRKLDYGVPCKLPPAPPPSPEQIEARKSAEAKKKVESEQRVLKFHMDLAAKGDPYGELCMGKRYASGDGVERDPGKAREFFLKALNHGSTEAQAQLDKLPK